jgi:hypothetical protein
MLAVRVTRSGPLGRPGRHKLGSLLGRGGIAVAKPVLVVVDDEDASLRLLAGELKWVAP